MIKPEIMGKKVSDSIFLIHVSCWGPPTQYFDEIVLTFKDIFIFDNNHFMLDIFYTVIPHFCLKKKKERGKKRFEKIEWV